MPTARLTVDVSGLLKGTAALLRAIEQGVDNGLDDGARLMAQVDRDTDAYVGMSGATRASTFATRIGPDKDSSREADAAYSAAADYLAGFTGHSGKPYVGDSGIVLRPGERGIILSNGTGYAADLEIALAGQKAHLGPTVQATADQVMALVASGIKEQMR